LATLSKVNPKKAFTSPAAARWYRFNALSLYEAWELPITRQRSLERTQTAVKSADKPLISTNLDRTKPQLQASQYETNVPIRDSHPQRLFSARLLCRKGVGEKKHGKFPAP
jgi:hypothetical protein